MKSKKRRRKFNHQPIRKIKWIYLLYGFLSKTNYSWNI